MKISTYTHPRHIVWLKYFIFVSGMILLLSLIYIDFVKYAHSRSVALAVLDILIIIVVYSISMLISAYYFGQTIIVTDEGLLVEFLWKELDVPWHKIIEIRPVFGSWRLSGDTKSIFIVLTNALTPFHRFLGLLYGLSVKPSFIIFPTISEYQSLVETIKSHTKHN